MTPRLVLKEVDPAAYAAMLAFGRYQSAGELPLKLRLLVQNRASQLNGCAFCLNMHLQEARHAGETQARLDLLAVWRETTLYTPAERAALALTEAVTRLPEGGIPDELWHEVRVHFDGAQTVAILMCTLAINSWNRLMVTLRVPPALPQAVSTQT